MKSKFSLFLSLTLIMISKITHCSTPGLNFMPQVVPDPNMASYNAFWDGAVGSRGYWGSLPQSPHSVFSPSFNTKGKLSLKASYNS